jgi:hypothetical protein
MHRLQQFIIGDLLPSISNLADAENAGWRAECRAEIVEIFLWLHLGVETGSFPALPSKDVYDSYLRPFFDSLLPQDDRLREEMRSGPRYVPHSPESNALILGLPRYAKILVEMAMRGDDVFAEERSKFANPGSLQGMFQTLLVLYSAFLQSRSARRFTYEVNFANQNEWEKDWQADCSADNVREAESLTSSSAVALTLAGYLTLWGYGANFNEAFHNLEGSREISRSDIFNLRERITQIQSWRIDLRGRQSSDRFEKIKQKIATEVETEIKTLKIDGRCLVSFNESIDSAFELWGVRSPVLVT